MIRWTCRSLVDLAYPTVNFELPSGLTLSAFAPAVVVLPCFAPHPHPPSYRLRLLRLKACGHFSKRTPPAPPESYVEQAAQRVMDTLEKL